MLATADERCRFAAQSSHESLVGIVSNRLF